MKTIKQWLQTIEDPEIRARALANMEKEEKSTKVENLLCALELGFIWDTTKEGEDYWYKIYNKQFKKENPSKLDLLIKEVKKGKLKKAELILRLEQLR